MALGDAAAHRCGRGCALGRDCRPYGALLDAKHVYGREGGRYGRICEGGYGVPVNVPYLNNNE